MDGNPASSSSSESAQIINRDYSFHRAVFNNDITVLKSLLETNEKAGIDDLDTNGRTALMLAVMLNHEDCAELLLKNGADANTQNSGNDHYY